MLSAFVEKYLGTLAVGAAVAALVLALLFYLVRSRKKSGGGCGCGCTSCPMKDKCHSQGESTEQNK